MVCAANDDDARKLVRMMAPSGRIWLSRKKSGEAMPKESCVVEV
jgi:hypothetical protein